MSTTLLKIGASIVLALLASSACTTGAFAQSAGCFQPPAKLSDADVNAFIASPASLLSENPTGGLPMSTKVRSLAGSSMASIDMMLSLLDQANTDQRSAIGSGLARAAKACSTINPEYAALIQEKIAGVSSPEVITAFLAASSEVQTAAVVGGATASAVGGGGTAASGIGGGGTAGAGSGNLSGNTSVAQSGSGYSTSGSGQYYSSTDSSVSVTNQ